MDANKIVLEAIALRKRIEALYNGGVVKLAPHILYTRHGELYVDAVTVARDGRPPRETKIGAFKLAGLKGMTLADGPFRPAPIFDPADSKYDGVALFAVEMG